MVKAGSEGRFNPLHDAHAIEQLVATVQFVQSLPDEVMRAAIGVVDEFHDALPGQEELRGMGLGFQFGPAGLSPIHSAFGSALDGRVRYKTDAAGVRLTEIRIDRQTLLFRTQAYTRWDAVWEEALRYFTAVLPKVEVHVAAVGLQYVDKFIWAGAAETCRPADLLRLDSPYVARRAMDSLDLWHCHSGQFRAVDQHTKRLEVVDLDCLDEGLPSTQSPPAMRRFVRISTAITDFFNQPNYEPLALAGAAALKQVQQTFPVLHQELKRVISEILNDENARRIGMTQDAA